MNNERYVDAMEEVANALGVEQLLLEEWRVAFPHLFEEQPFDLGMITSYLSHRGLISGANTSGPDSNPRLVSAMGDFLIEKAVAHARATETLAAAMEEPAFMAIIERQDWEGLEEAIRMSPPKKNWAPVSSNDRVAISLTKPMTSSLFFDRVWTLDPTAPHDIGVRLGTSLENFVLGLAEAVAESLRDSGKYSDEIIDMALRTARMEARMMDSVSRLLIPKLDERLSRPVQLYLGSRENIEPSFRIGNMPMIIATIESLNWVDEDNLSWEQVKEVRKDTDSTTQMRRMLHWFDLEMQGKPLSFLQDELLLRMDEFEEAARKHGICLFKGAMGTLINDGRLESTLGGVLATGVAGMTFGVDGAVISGVALTLAKGVHIAIETLRLHQSELLLRAKSPVAYLSILKSCNDAKNSD